MRRALFLIIFASAVFLLSVDSIIGYVSDFLVEQITSNLGISLFVVISAVFIIASFVIFQLIKSTTSEISSNSTKLRILYSAVMTTSAIADSSNSSLNNSDCIFLRILYCVSYCYCSTKPTHGCICDDHVLLDTYYLVPIQ